MRRDDPFGKTLYLILYAEVDTLENVFMKNFDAHCALIKKVPSHLLILFKGVMPSP